MQRRLSWILSGTGTLLVLYSIIAGVWTPVPDIPILYESIRNFFFHVPMWFAMLLMFLIGVIHSMRYLSSGRLDEDFKASSYLQTGVVFGILGLITGAVWARYTWGSWWSNDPKQNASAITLIIYAAYFILRRAIADRSVRGRVGAVYAVFAFAVAVPLLFILPRMTDSLHPGSGGNPAFSSYDLDFRMRPIFYAGVAGWTLIGSWLSLLYARVQRTAHEIVLLKHRLP